MDYYLFIISIVLSLPSCSLDVQDKLPPTVRQIAHRGYWVAGAPENSVDAVKLAIDANLYGAEIDIYETADHVIVVNHNDSYCGMHIPSSTYNDLIINDDNLPQLGEFLNILKDSYNSDFKLIIDVKFINEVSTLVNLIDLYSIGNRVEFISFYREYCEALINYANHYKVGYLDNDLSIQYLYQNGYDFIDFSYNTYLYNPKLVNEAHALGLDVYT